eukprot:s685_g1.t1
MDLRGGQQIDMTCWNHYWALERDNGSYHSTLEVNQQLTRALKSDSQVLGRMQMHFETAVGDSGDTGAGGLSLARLRQHAAGEEVLEEDEVLSYCDYLNVMFGRKRYKVYLWMYDISDGFAARWSWLLLGKDFKGIWHTGVVVEWPDKSSEFWFGGRIFDSQPGTTPFGEPVERRFLGYTYKRRAETWEYLTRHCASEFTRENYDVLTHNCNHFSEKLHMFLRNEHIPDEVLKQPDMVMQTITARALRPLLNRWLGGFESKDTGKALWDSLSPGALVEFVHEDSGRPLVGKVKSLRDNSAAQATCQHPEPCCSHKRSAGLARKVALRAVALKKELEAEAAKEEAAREERDKELDRLTDEVNTMKERTAKAKELLRQHARLREVTGAASPGRESERIRRLAEASSANAVIDAAERRARHERILEAVGRQPTGDRPFLRPRLEGHMRCIEEHIARAKDRSLQRSQSEDRLGGSLLSPH